MSLPCFPDMDKIPSREEVVNLIVSSIAMEELGLSHIINAEGEKLQYALGTIDGVPHPSEPVTLEDLLKLNESVKKTLDSTMMNQFLLKEKLIGALSSSVMQGPQGERGEPGPATIDVIGDVDTLEPGQAPYVTNEGTSEDVLLKFGIPKGTPGETGPVGVILDSFDTVEDLINAHPSGNQGDAYLVGGGLYVWNIETGQWENVGNLQGPQGTGTTIKGTAASKDELDQQHPQGPPDDAYLVNGEIYIWNETDGWHSGGSLVGPPGPGLEAGDPLFQISGTSTSSAAMGYEETLSFASDSLDISLETGPVVRIEAPASHAGSIIPFASGERQILNAPAGTGHRSNVLLVGFGSSATVSANESDPIQVITNETSGFQYAFTMPVDGKITAMSAFVTTVGLGGISGVDSRLSAKIYYSDEDSVYYSLLDDDAVLEFQFSGLIPSLTTRRLSKALSLNVTAGTRLLFIFDYDAAPYGAGVLINGHFGGSLKIE